MKIACSRRSNHCAIQIEWHNKLGDVQGLRSSTPHMSMITVIPSQFRIESCIFLSLWHKMPSRRTRSRFTYENPVGSVAPGMLWIALEEGTDFPKLIRGRKTSRSRSNSGGITVQPCCHLTLDTGLTYCAYCYILTMWRNRPSNEHR